MQTSVPDNSDSNRPLDKEQKADFEVAYRVSLGIQLSDMQEAKRLKLLEELPLIEEQKQKLREQVEFCLETLSEEADKHGVSTTEYLTRLHESSDVDGGTQSQFVELTHQAMMLPLHERSEFVQSLPVSSQDKLGILYLSGFSNVDSAR